MTPIELSEEQVLWFRARRGHLAGPGAVDPPAAARAVLGAQAQQPGPGLLALCQRTDGRPGAGDLEPLLLGPSEERRLVRTWGQRETLHIYDPLDWPLVAAARARWAPGGRRGPMPPEASLAAALEKLTGESSATRSDLLGVASKSYERSLAAHHGKYLDTDEKVRRFAAGRLLWCLAMRGDACIAHKVGSEQAYAARTIWLPDLKWPDIEPEAAAIELAWRYLAVNGPATAQDLAHHFGARVGEARNWTEALSDAGDLVSVRCRGRTGLLALADDADELRRQPPRALGEWPIRLLPQWDTYLMGHADKSWSVPDEGERKQVWRGQAVVAATVLDRGRVVAEWSQSSRRGGLEISVLPLSGWRDRRHRPGVAREGRTIAAHLGLGTVEVEVAAGSGGG